MWKYIALAARPILWDKVISPLAIYLSKKIIDTIRPQQADSRRPEPAQIAEVSNLPEDIRNRIKALEDSQVEQAKLDQQLADQIQTIAVSLRTLSARIYVLFFISVICLIFCVATLIVVLIR